MPDSNGSRAGAKPRARDPRLRALSREYLACRARGHVPAGEQDFTRYRFRLKGTRRYFDVMRIATACLRCTGRQVRWENETTGDLFRPTRWEYPDGYLLHLDDGESHIPRSAARLEEVRRWLDEHPFTEQTVVVVEAVPGEQ